MGVLVFVQHPPKIVLHGAVGFLRTGDLFVRCRVGASGHNCTRSLKEHGAGGENVEQKEQHQNDQPDDQKPFPVLLDKFSRLFCSFFSRFRRLFRSIGGILRGLFRRLPVPSGGIALFHRLPLMEFCDGIRAFLLRKIGVHLPLLPELFVPDSLLQYPFGRSAHTGQRHRRVRSGIVVRMFQDRVPDCRLRQLLRKVTDGAVRLSGQLFSFSRRQLLLGEFQLVFFHDETSFSLVVMILYNSVSFGK